MNAFKPIRVLITDDHAVVRSGLGAFMLAYGDLQLVGEARNGLEALDLCGKVHPDVVLMDLMMPIMDGPTATRAIRERYPHIQVIALTSFKEDEMVQQALEAGAIGYLLKNVSIEELSEAIRNAYAGRPTLAPEAAQALISVATQPRKHIFELTTREQEILELMVTGATNRDIAEGLFVSESTVKFHVSNILSKLGVTSRTEAVSMALQEGLVKKK